MAMIRTIVAGNWKMHKTVAQTRAYLETFLPLVESFSHAVEIVVAPPFTALAAAARMIDGTGLSLCAQTMHWELEGPYTGEISAPMLLEFGVRYVILGHSERRAYCNETDEGVNRKVHTALDHGLKAIVAVGETASERDAGVTDERVVSQVRAAFAGIGSSDFDRMAIAYEPIWAIGTGRNCDPAQADHVMGVIRNCMEDLQATPILYGGSMKAENVADYMAQPNINGGLVGGASLDPEGFATLIRNAAQ